jgi:hypothetical protein
MDVFYHSSSSFQYFCLFGVFRLFPAFLLSKTVWNRAFDKFHISSVSFRFQRSMLQYGGLNTAEAFAADCLNRGIETVSMCDEFETLYGEDVLLTKKDMDEAA